MKVTSVHPSYHKVEEGLDADNELRNLSGAELRTGPDGLGGVGGGVGGLEGKEQEGRMDER